VIVASVSDGLQNLRDALVKKFPQAHKDFLLDTQLSAVCGDYYFTHAGIRPGVALADQSAEDLMWIREPFLSSKQDYGKIVVHGHSIAHAPEQRPNRIGIDTGAYATGCLTCLRLEGRARTFLTT
jgi:serine/threonine protein phosphatase 1